MTACNRRLTVHDVTLSRKPANWSEAFAAPDRAGVPEDLLAGRDRSLPQVRETV